MLRWMLRVDNWLDVAPLENMEDDHSFLSMKKNLMKIIFFFLNLENLNFLKELKILKNFFFWKIWKSWIFSWNWKFWLMIFFFLLKNLEILNFFKELKILIFEFFFEKFGNLEFFHGNRVKAMKIYTWWFFFFGKTYPLNENNFSWKLMWIARQVLAQFLHKDNFN